MTKQETIKQIDAYVSDYLGAPSHLFGLSHRTRADLKMLHSLLPHQSAMHAWLRSRVTLSIAS